MTPIESVEHRFQGAEYGESICYDQSCRDKTNFPKILNKFHNGYGEEAKPGSLVQRDKVMNSAKEHEKQHPKHGIKVIFGHGEERKGPDGNSLTIFEYQAPVKK